MSRPTLAAGAFDSNGDSNRISQSAERLSELPERLALLFQRYVRVDRHRHLDVRVTGDIPGHVRRHAKIKQERHARVAKIVEPCLTESCGFPYRVPASNPRLASLCTPQTGLSSGTSSASILCIIGAAVEPGRSEACRARSKCGPAPRRCRRDGRVVAASWCRTLVPLADHQAGDGLGRRQRVAAEGL